MTAGQGGPAATAPCGAIAGMGPTFEATDARTGELVRGHSAVQVLRASGREPLVDPMALHEYLATGRLFGGTRTLLAHVRAVTPTWPHEVRGSAAEGEAAATPLRPAGDGLRESARVLLELLARSVGESMTGSAPAVAVSGGVDSSGLLALAARHAPDEPLDAYCYAAAPEDLSPELLELPWAERASAACGARLHRIGVEAAELPQLVVRTATEQDFPFASPVVVAQRKVFAAMAEAGHRKAMGGHGPEILFGGTAPYAALYAASLARRGHLLRAGRLVAGAARRLGASRRDLTAASLGNLLGLRPLRPPGGRLAAWASARWFGERAAPRARPPAPPGEIGPLIDSMLSASMGATSLAQEACNAAAAGLDNRQPYLAAPVIAFARALPAERCLSPQGEAKQVLRLALRGLVPDAILDRPERVGFAVPALPWLLRKRPWVESSYREMRSLPFFDGPSFEETWGTLEAGGARGWSVAWRVWRWIALLEWATARDARFE